jgi:1,4-alpha-glucan branching enzyme
LGEAVILFGGRLSGQKGAGKMIEALKDIRSSVPDAQLLVIGKKDAYAENMIAFANNLGIADKLVFTGWISGDQLRQAYWAASVVAVPSLYLDPFPTVNLEAFACHKPVVATCFGGSREIVEDGVSGYIVNPFDVPTMAAKLTELLIDKEKSAQFGQAGYQRVAKEFTLSQQAQQYERLFKND